MTKSLSDYTSGQEDRDIEELDDMIQNLDLSDDTRNKLEAAFNRVMEIVDRRIDEAYEDGKVDGAETAE